MSMSGRAVTALCTLSLVNFLENYMRTLISVSIIPFLDYDSYDYSLLSGTFFAIMYTCGGLFFALSPALHSKRVLSIAIACFVFSLATFSTALSNSVWLLIVIRMVMGLGQSVVTPFASGIIAAYFSYESRGIAFSIFNFGTYASFSLSLSLGTFMYDEYGWKAGYFLFGILGMAIALVMPLVMSDCPEETENVPEQGYESSQPLLLGGGGAVGSFSRVSSEGSYYEIEEEYEQESNVDDIRSCLIASPGGADNKKQEKGERVGSSSDRLTSVERHAAVSIVQTLVAVLKCWWRHPLLIVTCLATGIRLGAGYIWSSYTAVYFSELYLVEDRDDDCIYSSPSLLPSSDYLQLGISDVNKKLISSSGEDVELRIGSRTSISALHDSTTCGSDYPYCFSDEGECRKLNDYPWHNQGLEHIHLQEYMSWVPLVGSGFGSLVGGHVSDKMNSIFGLKGRPLVAGVSSLVSIPFVILALSSGFPACFLYFIPSGLTGEMYIGASLALVADLTPSALLVPSTALFMFFVTIIAGNCPLLIPLGLNNVMTKSYHTFIVSAANTPETSTMRDIGNFVSSYVEYTATERSGRDLQQVMTVIICVLYAVSSVIYFLVMLLCPRMPAAPVTDNVTSCDKVPLKRV